MRRLAPTTGTSQKTPAGQVRLHNPHRQPNPWVSAAGFRVANLRGRLHSSCAGTRDPDSATLPIEKWENGEIGEFYRPLKTPISIRIDNDVLAWLKSKGEGHMSRVNEILRNAMLSDLKR
jgi:uncharacterized protein (DUF4415 family)